MDTRVACVIPALDAEPTLSGVVSGLQRSLDRPLVIVVDDGSRDDTAQSARRVADEVVRFPVNRGKGAALRVGCALALHRGADVVVTIDADGQHDPAYARALVDATATSDLVIGARARAGTTMPAGRRLTNALSAAAVARCIGYPVADAQSGYRAIRASVLRAVAARGDRYEFETEFLILAAKHGFRVGFVPVPTHYGSAVPSRFRPLRDSMRIVRTLWRFNTGFAF